jgi:tetratricopeptide (TPR) repeat protein
VNADPNLAEGHILLGKLLARDQRLAEAVSEYQQAVKLQPGFSLAHLDLGLALAAQGPRTSASVCPLPDIADYRHAAKHVPIPEIVAQEVTVEIILTWSQDLFIPPDAPRTGRELEVFHLANAFLQKASVNAADCDVSMEISETADKGSLRMIVETPVDREYCGARQNLQAQLKKHGFRLDSQHGGELPQALPVDVVGMAFEDFEHDRGPVATLWEIHPAIVTLH